MSHFSHEARCQALAQVCPTVVHTKGSWWSLCQPTPQLCAYKASSHGGGGSEDESQGIRGSAENHTCTWKCTKVHTAIEYTETNNGHNNITIITLTCMYSMDNNVCAEQFHKWYSHSTYIHTVRHTLRDGPTCCGE